MLFDELTSDEILSRVRLGTLRAPNLIGFEVANACLKKIRAAPGERETLLEAFSLLDALSISLETVDLKAASVLAEQTKLTLHDANYLWLARALGAELVTLDEKLARAHENLQRFQQPANLRDLAGGANILLAPRRKICISARSATG